MRRPGFAALALALALAQPTRAAAAPGDSLGAPGPGASATARAVKPFAFQPAGPGRCRAFLVAEASLDRVFLPGGHDAVDRYALSNNFGLMANVDARQAIGGSLDLHLVRGHLRATPTLRYKRWLGRERSVDASLGWAAGRPGDSGLEGPVLNLRYCPAPVLFVQAGVATYKDVPGGFWDPEYGFRYQEERTTFLHAGAGVAGVPAVAAFGAELVGLLVLVAFVAGMGT